MIDRLAAGLLGSHVRWRAGEEPALRQRAVIHGAGQADELGDIEIVPAMQGRLGVELARQHKPVAVLLDLHLPDIDGEEVHRRLRDDPVTQHTPVVIVTADATQGQVGRLLAAGAHSYLTKPLDVPAFLAMIDGLMAARRD